MSRSLRTSSGRHEEPVSEPEDSFEEYQSAESGLDDQADQYLLAQGTSSKTSKNSFATKLQNFNLEEEEIKKFIQANHERFCRQLEVVPYKQSDLRKIYHMLTTTELNVLVYGLGSKLKMLTDLAGHYFHDRHHHIILRGFSMDITLKQVMLTLNRAADNAKNAVLNESELFDLLNEYYDSNCLYLFIHSIDVLFTKNHKIFNFLSRLFKAVKNVRFVASLDHINSPLMWSVGESSIFQWTWYHVTTYEPYSVEKKSSSGISMISTSSKSWKLSIDLSSMKHVYESLNTNAQKIFVIILKNFLDSNNTQGYPFHDLYLQCREDFLVNSEITLRAQLSEFKDHNLLKTKKSPDGSELIKINVDKETVRQFIQSLEG